MITATRVVLPVLLEWGPVLLKFLSKLIKYAKDMYATWVGNNSGGEKDAVMLAMKLINQFKDNMEDLLRDTKLKNKLLEGLAILVRGINSTSGQSDCPPPRLALPSNGDVLCNGASGGLSTVPEGMTMMYEQQIEYAILLSQQEAQNRGATYVEDQWREILEAEDEMLAMAMQESEIYEASRIHVQPGTCSAKNSEDRWCHDKRVSYSSSIQEDEREESTQEGSNSKCYEDECTKDGEKSTEEYAAFLRDEEDLILQMIIQESRAACCSRNPEEQREDSSQDECTTEGKKCTEEYASFLRDEEDMLLHMAMRDSIAGCSSSQKEEEEESTQDECNRTSCEDECTKEREKCTEEHAAFLSNEEDMLIQMATRASSAACCSSDPKEERENITQDECNGKSCEDECTKEGEKCTEEYAAFLRHEEDMLIQMAIRASLQEAVE